MIKEAIASSVFFIGVLVLLVTVPIPPTTPTDKAPLSVQYSIYLDYEIPDVVTTAFRQNIILLQNANPQDTVTIHINSPGGSFMNTVYLINAMKTSRARVVTIVEAQAQSGAGITALSADSVHMLPNTILQLHTVDTISINCVELMKGNFSDRGHDGINKCEQAKKAYVDTAANVINGLKLLLPSEKQQLLDGYDLFFTAEEINLRQRDMSKATPQTAPADKDRSKEIEAAKSDQEAFKELFLQLEGEGK